MTDTVEQAPGPGARRPRRAGRYALIAFLVTFVIGTVLAAGSALVYGATYEGLIMPGVSIGGVRVGGLGRAEAESRLSGSVPVATLGELTMTVGDVRSVVPYSAIGRRYDFSAAITAAMTIGRTGNVIDRPAEQLRTLVRGADIGLAIGYDAALVDGSVADLVVSVEHAPREARVIVDGSDGAAAAWRVEPAQTGVDVDEAALRAAAHSALDSLGLSNGSTQISIAPTFMEPRFTTAEAERAAAQANAISGTGLVLVDGTTTYSLTSATLRSWLTVAQNADGDFATSVDTASIGTMLPTLLAGIGTPATEASFKFGDGNTVLVVPGRTGRAVDLPATLDSVIGALDSRGAGSAVTSVPVSVVAVEPSFSTTDAEATAPQVTRVSRWTTRYISSDHNFFGANISIPTTIIDGTVVAPGKKFDFWDAVGETSRENGYGPGGAIINGHTDPTGIIGGGICSCSTTLFNAALRAGLEIIQRRNHYYYIDRYPVGLDATVFKSSYGSEQSMRFRNDTEFPILIRGINTAGAVRFEIWTVPTGRTVELSEPRIKGRTEAVDTIVYTDDKPVGSSERIEYPTAGFRSWVTRIVRDAAGAIIREDEFYSRYSAVDGVTLIGVTSDDRRNGTTVVLP